MLTTYIRIALRTFARNKVAFGINLLGLSIALGCCIAAYVNYKFNAGFDGEQKHVNNLYRIGFNTGADDKLTSYGVTPMPIPNLVKANFPDVSQVIRYVSKGGMFRIEDEMFENEFVYADPAFTNTFSLTLLSGSRDISNKSGVLISDKLARTYFNTDDVVGNSLTQIVAGVPRDFVITGVFKAFPANSSFRFNLLTHYENYFSSPSVQNDFEHDWKKWVTVFIEIENEQTKNRVQNQLQQYVSIQNDERPDLMATEFFVESFQGMSGRAVRSKMQGHWFNMPMPPAAVVAPFIMAAFLLLVACFNFTNNAIAVAGKRLKEIGIRKVVGGKRKELILQFLCESFVFCTLALLMSMFLAKFFVAGWDAMWPGIDLTLEYAGNLDIIAILFALVLGTTFLAGAYPAFYISAFKPLMILKGTTRFGGSNGLVKGLLVFQFSISLIAVIFATAFYFNARFQKEYDLGYSYQRVIQIPVENATQYTTLRDRLEQVRDIDKLGGTEHHIYNSNLKASATYNALEKEVDLLNVGENYFETVNVRLISGANFEKDSQSDADASVIVNEEFVKQFQMQDPVGKRILLNDTTRYYIKGVVKDVYLNALFRPISPVVFKYVMEDRFKYLVFSAAPDQLNEINKKAGAEWKKLFPNELYRGKPMEERMIMAMEHFDNVIILYTFLGIVAIIMSASGLYSLVSINLQKRTKELGVRKILGAPLGSLFGQASKLYFVVMLMAFTIGSVTGSILVNKLMDNIWEYYVRIGIEIISFSILTLLAISFLTVAARIFAVVRANPADSLRYE